MKAIIDASEFKRLIDNTKRFTNSCSSNKLMQYIYLEVEAETKKIRAVATDGHRASVEYSIVNEVDESFRCYIKPTIPKITKRDMYVELELVDKKAYVTVNDNIMGYLQPEGKYFEIDKLIKDTEAKEVTASIWVNPVLLKQALKSANYGYREPIKIEIRGKKDPLIIRRNRGRKDIKLVLPVNVSEGGE